MGFYFCGRYINTDCDDKYVEWVMFEALFVGVLMIIVDMKLEKEILKIFIAISFGQLRINVAMPDLS